ncbi:MAG: hypothetical protein V4623_07680 [Pseudomonadota bacterium]
MALNLDAIDQQLSLGSKERLGEHLPFSGAKNQRLALRALLLCQRVFFSDLWAEAIFKGGVRRRTDCLANNPNWRQQSIDFWLRRGEREIRNALFLFTATSQTPAALADAAMLGSGDPNLAHPNLCLARETGIFPGASVCYTAVMNWLLRSGLASYPWYMKNGAPNDQKTLREVFGEPEAVIWDQTKGLFRKGDRLPIVPRGYIVHMYIDTPQRWLGHWVVSLGDGLACGVNNFDTDGTSRAYSDRCSISSQFFLGYQEQAADLLQRAVVEIINPLTIPGRANSV